LIRNILPSKILILLLAACLMWIGLLSIAFMLFMGQGAVVGWIVAGVLAFSLIVWVGLMLFEVRQAFEVRSEADEDCHRVTGSLPRVVQSTFADPRSWSIGRLNFGRSVRPGLRREKVLGRSRAR
jgi:hypothetical protein